MGKKNGLGEFLDKNLVKKVNLGTVGRVLEKRMVKKSAKELEGKSVPALPDGVFDKINAPVSDHFTVGFAKAEVMPDDVLKKNYYVAGYSAYNPAKNVLDPMTVSAVYIDDNSGRGGVVFVSVDSVGLTNYDVNLARENLLHFTRDTGCRSINILSTHNHAGIDTVGMWGPLPISGRNPKFMDILHKGIVDVVTRAYENRRDGDIFYGRRESEEIQRDSRLPHVFNKYLTRLRFVPSDGSREVWMLNYASHTESMLGINTVSADFACYMRRKILEDAGADSIYFVGAIGGLIRLKELDPDPVRSTIMGGESLARTAVAIEDTKKLEPVINILRQEYYADADNYLLANLCDLGVLKSCRVATGKGTTGYAIKTEMTYFEMGSLNMLLLPSELFPELAYGGYLSEEESAEGKSPSINPEPLVKTAGDEELLVFGVANDFTGYVVPPNDFLLNPASPYLDGVHDRLDRNHYEETNSLGPNTAYFISDTFKGIMEKVNAAKKTKKK